jgi:DnaJ-class molecular chaperone
MENSTNHYEIFKLKRDCSSGDIRKAFKELIKEYHPVFNFNLQRIKLTTIQRKMKCIEKSLKHMKF